MSNSKLEAVHRLGLSALEVVLASSQTLSILLCGSLDRLHLGGFEI